MNIFINAYIALYGGTKDNARRVWRATDKEYHDLIIESFKQNAHESFTMIKGGKQNENH